MLSDTLNHMDLSRVFQYDYETWNTLADYSVLILKILRKKKNLIVCDSRSIWEYVQTGHI